MLCGSAGTSCPGKFVRHTQHQLLVDQANTVHTVTSKAVAYTVSILSAGLISMYTSIALTRCQTAGAAQQPTSYTYVHSGRTSAARPSLQADAQRSGRRGLGRLAVVEHMQHELHDVLQALAPLAVALAPVLALAVAAAPGGVAAAACVVAAGGVVGRGLGRCRAVQEQGCRLAGGLVDGDAQLQGLQLLAGRAGLAAASLAAVVSAVAAAALAAALALAAMMGASRAPGAG